MSGTFKAWREKLPEISQAMSRFPFATLSMAVVTAILIFAISTDANETIYFRTCVGLILSAYVCVMHVVSRDARGRSSSWLWQISLTCLIVALAILSERLRLNLPMAVGAVLLFLGNAIRFRQSPDDLKIWDFTHKIWIGAGFATLGSIIFTLGVLAIFAALKSLFGLDLEDLMTHYILPLGLAFLAPLYWLSTIPVVDEPNELLKAEPGFVSKAAGYLGLWLLAPLTFIYALILLAYGLKILVLMELPKGEIAALTTPFLLIGTLTWLVLFPPFIRDKWVARVFRRSWFFLTVPVTLMLAIAVAVRIGQYGLTQDRIALVLCVIWALIISALFIFKYRNGSRLHLIPSVAGTLLVIGTFVSGPLSLAHQWSRAESRLIELGVMDASGMIQPVEAIKITDIDLANDARGALDHVIRLDGDAMILNRLPVSERSVYTTEKGSLDSFDFYKRIGLGDLYETAEGGMYLNYYMPNEFLLDVTDYDYLFPSNFFFGRNMISKTDLYQSQTLSISKRETRLMIKSNGLSAEFDFESWARSLPVSGRKILLDDPLVHIASEDGIVIDFIVTEMNMNVGTNGETEALTLNGNVLVSGVELD